MKYFKWTDEAKAKFIQMYPVSSMEDITWTFLVVLRSAVRRLG